MKTKIDFTLIENFISEKDFNNIEPEIKKSWELLTTKTGAGSDFTGWIDFPSKEKNSELLLKKIEATCEKVKNFNPDTILVIGIGGSYLGTRAIYDALTPAFCTRTPEIIFAGHQIDGHYHANLLNYLEKRNTVVVVISKSGTTTEPAIAFRLIRTFMEKKYGNESSQRIIVVTDKNKGALKSLANTKGYETFEIPSDIGGRFSVLTAVGLLPLGLCGFSIREIINGAAECEKELLSKNSIQDNIAMRYAAIRQILYRLGKTTEIQSSFYPQLATFSEWWKQLFGESEGKNQKGIFPASVVFSTDLHSLGQYIQDGTRNIFESFLSVNKIPKDVNIPVLNSNDDELLYLEGKSMSYVNNIAEKATQIAHAQGGVPVISFDIPELSEYYLGELMYMFEFSCALSAYTMGVNPFDQPGVEAYKSKMFEMLGK
ncbi:MAG: glucose-6-phosphate isomerase [Bacteroidales bacterium]|nr:glucose-6-phosphate isomerase [Bacteroidales bacterium]